MPSGKHKSRSMRRVFKKTPGGRTVLHYEKRKPEKPQCGICGTPLQSTARGRAADVKKLPKSQRRPERPYGGVLCSGCTRRVIREDARENSS